MSLGKSDRKCSNFPSFAGVFSREPPTLYLVVKVGETDQLMSTDQTAVVLTKLFRNVQCSPHLVTMICTSDRTSALAFSAIKAFAGEYQSREFTNILTKLGMGLYEGWGTREQGRGCRFGDE